VYRGLEFISTPANKRQKRRAGAPSLPAWARHVQPRMRAALAARCGLAAVTLTVEGGRWDVAAWSVAAGSRVFRRMRWDRGVPSGDSGVCAEGAACRLCAVGERWCEMGSVCSRRELRCVNSRLPACLFQEWRIRKVDVRDNMSNVSEERSTRQQDIKKGLQFIEYGFAVLLLCPYTCVYQRWVALGRSSAYSGSGGGRRACRVPLQNIC